MMEVTPIGETLGACVTNIDLSKPLSDSEFGAVFRALGDYGVLKFPDQGIGPSALRDFSARFGDLQILSANGLGEPGFPEISILSNIVENGINIGIPDAGQDWHTDMSYNSVVGFVNVLVALEVPVRDGNPLGATEFANAQAAYQDLPSDIKIRLADATAQHDINKFHEHMRRNRGSSRPALTEAQRRERPPCTHPVFLMHPITGRKVIYVNPGFTEQINGLSQKESDETLEYLFDHILKPKYRYINKWAVGDLLIWDHIGTWHYAKPDYRADEHRLMKRCQVLAERVFDPSFVANILHASARA